MCIAPIAKLLPHKVCIHSFCTALSGLSTEMRLSMTLSYPYHNSPKALSLSLDKIFGDAKAVAHTAWELWGTALRVKRLSG